MELPGGGCRVPDGGFLVFCFLRDDSLPLASELFAELGRFLLGRPDGVVVPLVELPEDG